MSRAHSNFVVPLFVIIGGTERGDGDSISGGEYNFNPNSIFLRLQNTKDIFQAAPSVEPNPGPSTVSPYRVCLPQTTVDLNHVQLIKTLTSLPSVCNLRIAGEEFRVSLRHLYPIRLLVKAYILFTENAREQLGSCRFKVEFISVPVTLCSFRQSAAQHSPPESNTTDVACLKNVCKRPQKYT
ncbi:hypothetical protein K474DRAFT_1680334 [Panus rudis PR-1116 ss-1]|nr:hypothetical protein K474DRAFT_1680334 [Panus rudis PR-1116 ss-1]